MKKTFIFSVFMFIFLYTGLCQQKKNILFIGNSYTFYNNLPQMLADMALTTNDTIIFDSSTPGGFTLQGHSTNQTTLNKIMAGEWDFVVLQEQSQRPSFPLSQVQAEVFPYAHFLDSLINVYNPCAETVFYMTWGRKNGDAANCPVWPPVCTYEGMDSLLHLRYMMMAEMNDAIISPVGAVWRYIRTNYPSIELYDPDESHPSLRGTYAAALTFYSALFRKNPLQVQFNSSLSVTEATNIKNAVKAVVFDSLTHWFIGQYDPVAAFTINGQIGFAVSFSNNSLNATEFYWDFGDGNVSWDEHPTHEYASNGDYQVTLIASHCSYSDTISSLVQISFVNIEEPQLTELFKVYPNPANELLSILPSRLHTDVKFYITDLFGREISVVQSVQGNEIILDVSFYPSGIYILHVFVQGKHYVRKFVKM